MSWIRYQFYRKKLGIIPSIKEGSRGLSKASALSVPVKVVLKRSVFRAQETSQELCTSASQVPPTSVGIYCIKRGAPIRWINKAIPSTVPSSHENEGGTAAMELSEFHVFKKATGVESSPCTVGRQIVSILFRIESVFQIWQENLQKKIFSNI